MALAEKIFAGLALALCIVLMVRLALGPARRWRCDRAVVRSFGLLRSRAVQLVRWRTTSKAAARAADEAIRRARGRYDRDGNVYRPRDFKGPRKPH